MSRSYYRDGDGDGYGSEWDAGRWDGGRARSRAVDLTPVQLARARYPIQWPALKGSPRGSR